MEDFSKPVRPYRGRGRETYVPRTIFNPAADVLAGIEYVEGTFKERRDKVNLFQQQAEQRRIDMQKLVNDTQRIDQTDTIAKMTDQFSNMVTDIYKADIASFDGDRSDYLVKANNAQKVIGDFGKVIGVVDELSNKFKNMNPAEQKKTILRSQFMGEDGDRKMEYLKFLNDPSKMNIRIQGGDIVITNDGKDLFNGTQLLNSVKAGNNLIEYADNYEDQINLASKEAMKGIGDLAIIRQYQKMSNDGTELTNIQDADYRKSMQAYAENLKNSEKIDALINESTFQRYADSPEVFNVKKHGKLTKDKIIEFLVKKQFPGGGYTTQKVVTKEIQGPSVLDLRKMSLKERQQKLKEIKFQKELEEELAPKFKNEVGDKYSKDLTDNFLTARKKYLDIQIAVKQMSDYTDGEGNFTQEGINELDKFYPGISDLELNKINTPLTLKTTLMREFLKKDDKVKGVDYDTFIVMNKDYENFLKEQEGATSKGGAAQFNTNQ